MTADGIVIPIALTQDVIGRLVSCGRPTVSLTLHALADDGRLTRRGHDHWMLTRDAISP
jgi:hypothetical protein